MESTSSRSTMSQVGASPAKKQKQMGRSYAAVVRSSFKPTQTTAAMGSTPGTAAAAMTSSSDRSNNAAKIKSQASLETRRQAAVAAAAAAAAEQQQQQQQQLRVSASEVDVQSFLRKLDQALELEVKYRGAVQPSSNGFQKIDAGTITSGMRDGSAHVLRCLKVWYDLPSDVLFNAISSIDRFLAKMKAQPKHLSCIAVSAFHLACNQYCQLQQEQQQQQNPETAAPSAAAAASPQLVNIPDPADLVSISQSRCSPSDLLRMQNILQSKLEINPAAGPEPPVTSLTFLKLMYSVCRATALRLELYDLLPPATSGCGAGADAAAAGNDLPCHLVHQLEILACDSLTLNYRPCEIALALLATDIQCRVAKDPKHTPALRFLSELQKYCNIPSEVFVNCLGLVMSQLDKYNSECMVAHRQRLVWKLSNRTLRHLRPTDKLRATLPTIKESGAPIPRVRSPSDGSIQSEEDTMSMSSEEDLTECCCHHHQIDEEDETACIDAGAVDEDQASGDDDVDVSSGGGDEESEAAAAVEDKSGGGGGGGSGKRRLRMCHAIDEPMEVEDENMGRSVEEEEEQWRLSKYEE